MAINEDPRRCFQYLLNPDENEDFYIDRGLDLLEEAIICDGTAAQDALVRGVWWLFAAFGIIVKKPQPAETELEFLVRNQFALPGP